MSISEPVFCRSHAVMGLDLSLRSAGICVISYPQNDKRDFSYATVGYNLNKAIERDKVVRILDIADQVIERCIEHQVKAVGIEGYAFGAKVGLAQLGELTGVVKAKCLEKLGIVCSAIPCQSVRKYLLEKAPNVSLKAKRAVRQFIEQQYHLKFSNNDESDAVAVALVMDDFINAKRQFLQSFQIEILHRMDDAQGRFKP